MKGESRGHGKIYQFARRDITMLHALKVGEEEGEEGESERGRH